MQQGWVERPDDLPARYTDKIYLGRDVLRLDRLERDHFGLRDIRRVLREQTEKLRRRLQEHAPDALRVKLEEDFLGDLQELARELLVRGDDPLLDHIIASKRTRHGIDVHDGDAIVCLR